MELLCSCEYMYVCICLYIKDMIGSKGIVVHVLPSMRMVKLFYVSMAMVAWGLRERL